ncbi:MAG: hypothetical protein ACR2L2_08310 [Acidobacteriota bacterium]
MKSDLSHRAICGNVRAAANRIPGDRLIVTLRGAHHFSFSDEALVKSQIVLKALGALGVTGGLDSRSGLAFTFFNVHLRGAPRDVLYGAPLVSAAHFETQ